MYILYHIIYTYVNIVYRLCYIIFVVFIRTAHLSNTAHHYGSSKVRSRSFVNEFCSSEHDYHKSQCQ